VAGRALGKIEKVDGKVANYTFLYGCDPAKGVAADTKFVHQFIAHLKNHFDPNSG
jgi:hypothetical protein